MHMRPLLILLALAAPVAAGETVAVRPGCGVADYVNPHDVLRCAVAADLPDPVLTPGFPTRDDLPASAVCTTKWGLDHRAVTPAMKREVMERYHMTAKDCPSGKVEIDHLIPRELLGKDATENLWAQCYEPKGSPAMGAHKKDRLENRLHREVCAGTTSLEDAQRAIATDWIAAYRKRFGGQRVERP